MTSLNELDIQVLFQTVASRSFFEQICKRLAVRFGSGIYNVPVVVWLMIRQRLQAQKTLVAVVQWLCQAQAGDLVGNCKRVRDRNISPQPGRFLPSAAGVA